MFKTVSDKPEEYADLQSLSGTDEKTALATSGKLVMKLYSPCKIQAEHLDDL